jgi:metal-responsive CopG/Arc/MetJ family transcriptional regulator
MVIARRQILVQLSDDLVSLLDGVAARRGVSRSALIREAIESHLHDEQEAEIDRQIVEAYKRMPQTEEEIEWAERGLSEMLRRMDEEEERAGETW